ncbi:beta-ketoacyl synthase N-terminal-like domain-containing protein [Streptomyces sp. NPDC006510]|uniref:beta-ketoacyl synthase N-terminal-like domain-containing protein n=1 Tax=Streptomyces sp. NPDC006510 TaxID=3155600 RepID=UPI0033BA1150
MTKTVISAWSAVSPFGMGRDAFVGGFHDGRSTVAPVDREQWRTPDDEVCLVPGFTPAGALGKKGTRAMDRATGLAVSAVGRLIDESPGDPATISGEEVALVLGTTSGSVQSMMDFTRGGLVSEKPYFVDPARFPNAVMNCAAGQCAIRHQLKGPNATIAGGRVSGLHALKYSQRLLNARRARTVLCGAVEEYADARAWLDRHARGEDETGTVHGEGCVMLRIEPEESAQGTPLATVQAVEVGVFAGGGENAAPVLDSCVRRALERSGTDPADVWTVAPSGARGALGDAEQSVLDALFDPAVVNRVSRLIGDTAGAAAMFQMAGVLAVAERAGAAGRTAVVTAVDRDGEAGCAVLRLR